MTTNDPTLPTSVTTNKEILVHRIAIEPTLAQKEAFRQAAGIARFVWNWALENWQNQYAEHRLNPALPRPNEAALRRQLNAIKAETYPWMSTAPKAVPQQAIKNLGRAFRNFFAGRAGYPRFKVKDCNRDSFRVDNGPGTFRIVGRRLKAPRFGWLKLREELRFHGEPISVTISRECDRWFAAVAVRACAPAPLTTRRPSVGVDLGVTDLAVISDGTRIPGPKALRRNMKSLRRRSRAHARKRRGSANRRRSARRLARLHARIRNIRRDALHKLTTSLARDYGKIGIEDLNVRGMMANRHLASAIGDAGFHEFRRQLSYKAARTGTILVVAGRFFPSSKICSKCGDKATSLPLSVRDWTCAGCGAMHDRDTNAAINLRKLAASCAVTACGADSTGPERERRVKLAAMKHESVQD